MDTLINVAHGFGVALAPINLLYCFVGVFIGTLVGVLPGIGPISAMSLLLPVTLAGTPESGIIMMAGIYYGSMYGGSTTSILVNIPGEAASVVTCIDGHQMAKQGRAGPALGISALGSFIAGTFSLVALMLVAPSLAAVAIAFGPAEYASLMVLGLVVLTFLTQGSMAKALLMACIGIVLGLIGLDSITAQPRLTFGRIELIDGIGLVPVVMGLFGLSEVLLNTEQVIKRDIINAKITQLLPSKDDWKASANLTLNVGIRYEYAQPYLERHDNQAAFIAQGTLPGAGTGEYRLVSSKRNVVLAPAFTNLLTANRINLVYTDNRFLVQPQKNNFAPRVGLAYKLGE